MLSKEITETEEKIAGRSIWSGMIWLFGTAERTLLVNWEGNKTKID